MEHIIFLKGGDTGLNKDLIFKNRSALTEKVKESVSSVLPIILIVAFLCMTVAPISSDLLLSFLIGAVMVVTGMGFFSLGAEMSMTPIGSKIGTDLTKTKNLPLILAVSFALGFAVPVAEPDLQVLAESVPHINNSVLLVTVGVGVGFFLSVCMLRMITGIRLRWLLIFFYIIVFVLAAFTQHGEYVIYILRIGQSVRQFNQWIMDVCIIISCQNICRRFS